MQHTTDNQWKIIKLGGSILAPEWPDKQYLRQLVDIITMRVHVGEKFLIIIGGGYVCRQYQDALKQFDHIKNDDLDWMGIHTIMFNAQLVRMAFGEIAYKDVIARPSDLPETDKSVIICGAEEPGHSSNYDAVIFAERINANQIINLSNVDYVYDADPRDNPNATKYPEVTWEQYRSFIPSEWIPGMSTPFDPIAAESAQNLDLDVIFMKGRPIENLAKYLEKGEIEGSIISSRFA